MSEEFSGLEKTKGQTQARQLENQGTQRAKFSEKNHIMTARQIQLEVHTDEARPRDTANHKSKPINATRNPT